MTCHSCQSACKRFGKHRNGLQRFRCRQCLKTFTEERPTPLHEMRLPVVKAVTVLKLLVEGMSLRSVERITQIHRDTIMRLLVIAGRRCEVLHDTKVRNITPRYLQCDEIWTYVLKKRNKARYETSKIGIGDQWVFVGMDAETKLVASFRVGKRSWENTTAFLDDLYSRMAIGNHVQLTTDGFHFYKLAVPMSFGLDVDFAQLIKLFGDFGERQTEARYSPNPIAEVISRVRNGNPDPEHVSTSYVERQNLTMRMQMRRLTRLTNAFSKKLENLEAAINLHFAWYNFCRVHRTLRVTPAMEAGITDHVWTISELLLWS